jgi:protein RecA
MIEIFGHESSGKSLLTLYLIASAQKQGLNCALLDVEQSFDPKWAAQHGVDVHNLFYGNDFENGEQALEYAYQIVKCGKFGIVVIDSTAALTPKSELEGTLEDNARVGEQARILSRGCRKIRSACGSGGTTCIFVNQTRMKIGVMFGNPETTPGGKALKFYSDQRIKTYAKGKIKVKEAGEEIIVGQISVAQFVKNKTARPFGSAEFKIIFDPTSMNPVVMLANALKSQKLIKVYKGLFNIPKGVLGNKEKIETGATTMVELADYLISEDLVITMLDKLTELLEDDPTADQLDEAILELKDDPSKIVSPTNAKLDAKQVDDAREEDFNAEELEDVSEEELPK